MGYKCRLLASVAKVWHATLKLGTPSSIWITHPPSGRHAHPPLQKPRTTPLVVLSLYDVTASSLRCFGHAVLISHPPRDTGTNSQHRALRPERKKATRTTSGGPGIEYSFGGKNRGRVPCARCQPPGTLRCLSHQAAGLGCCSLSTMTLPLFDRVHQARSSNSPRSVMIRSVSVIQMPVRMHSW